MEIRIVSRSLKSKEMLESLSSLRDADVSLEIRDAGLRLRAIEPTILVATLSAAGASLGALLKGIFDLLKEREMRKVVVEIKGESKKIEIPADYPIEQVEYLIEKMRTMEIVRVELV